MNGGYGKAPKDLAERLREQDRQAILALNEAWDRHQKLLKAAPEVTLQLSKRGWFLSITSHMSILSDLESAITAANFDKADRLMAAEIRRRVNFIESLLSGRNPKRKAIFKEAFDNHKNGRYYSSITLLLSQVDGMCKERFGQAFFSLDRSSKVSKLRPSIANLDLRELNYLKVAFDQLTAINDASDKAGDYPISLNRHNILHGFDTDYGSEMNSLRVISFLSLIHDVVCQDMTTGLPREFYQAEK